eukprot:m.132001 g.132001  ORF g.132001 m.132001 type:complete len:154 (-) comp15764_c0_seq1:75-536(-)
MLEAICLVSCICFDLLFLAVDPSSLPLHMKAVLSPASLRAASRRLQTSERMSRSETDVSKGPQDDASAIAHLAARKAFERLKRQQTSLSSHETAKGPHQVTFPHGALPTLRSVAADRLHASGDEEQDEENPIAKLRAGLRRVSDIDSVTHSEP